jgi:undecaprenyl-diphosphatase
MEAPEVAHGRLQQLLDFEHTVCRRLAAAVAGVSAVAVLRAASRIGDWPLSVVVGLLLAATHGVRAFTIWTVASLTAVAVQKQLKARYRRLRPCERPGGPPQRAPIPDLGSFPSGHTLHAVMAAVVVAHLLPVLTAGFTALAALIGLSRVVLGVHFPSDVAAGAALGTVFAVVAAMLM